MAAPISIQRKTFMAHCRRAGRAGPCARAQSGRNVSPFGLLHPGRCGIPRPFKRAHYDGFLFLEGSGMRIKGQADIDISISDEGYIVLKQRNGDTDDHVVEFAPAYGAKVADAIEQLQEFAQAKFDKAALVEE